MERKDLFLASEDAHRTHVKSLVFQDYQKELKDWLDDAYQRITTEDDHNEVMRFQGRIQAIMEVLNMHERIISIFDALGEAEEESYGN
jgi:hypothetical protein